MKSRARHTGSLVALAFGVSCLVASPIFAQSAPVNPDPRLEAYYRDNAGEIDRLRASVTDEKLPVEQRRKALADLAFKYEDAALTLAAKLVNDPATDLARDAVALLSNSVVMADHGDKSAATHSGDHKNEPTASAWSRYIAAQHNLAREALRSAIKDSRSDIRAVGLQGLLPLSDETALKFVQERAEKGDFTDAQAVRLCAQALSNAGRSCVLGYLDKGSVEAKTAAVDVLGSIPTYRPMVRDKIFFSTTADPKVRAAAAEALSRYDPSFLNYALSIAIDPKTPREVFKSAVEGFARSSQAQGKWNSVQKTAIDNAAKNVGIELQTIQVQ